MEELRRRGPQMKPPISPYLRRSLFVFSLSLGASCTAAYGISELIRSLGFATSMLFSLGGVSLGWFLSQGQKHRPIKATITLLFGALLSLAVNGRLGYPLGDLLQNLQTVLGNLPLKEDLDWTPVLDSLGYLLQSILVLGRRIASWMRLIALQTPVYDPIVSSILGTLALWTSTLAIGWWTRQKRTPLLAYGPVLVVLTYGLSITGSNTNSILPILGCLLLLLALSNEEYKQQPEGTISLRIEPTLDMGIRRSAFLLTVGLLIAAAILPSISLQAIQERLSNLIETLSDSTSYSLALGLTQEESPASLNPLISLNTGGLPVNHLIGAPPELREQVALEFRIDAETLGDDLPQPDRMYWRVVTYDRYNGRGWSTSPTTTTTYSAGEILTPPTDLNKVVLPVNVRILREPAGLLFHPGEIASVDQEFKVAWRSLQAPFGRADAFGATVSVSEYQVEALLAQYGSDDLRESQGIYPTGMIERYTALPDSISDRVIEVANDLTATLATPFDRALAIESYVRRFPYTLEVPPLPLGVEISEYFLFDLQQGYCDYYATSMVVLARAAGLPTRLVVGYIGSQYDESRGLYQVTEDRAHSWVEIFFPGYGWIEFEPTAGRPPLEHPREVALVPRPQPPRIPTSTVSPDTPWALTIAAAGLGSLLVVIAGWFTWAGLDSWHLKRMPPENSVRTMFGRLVRILRWLEVPILPSDSPYDLAYKLASYLRTNLPARLGRISRETTIREIHSVVHTFVGQRYGDHPPDHPKVRKLLRSWPTLRWRLAFLALRHHLARVLRWRRNLQAKL
jgi:transglutaminase-like putative cysteine protease